MDTTQLSTVVLRCPEVPEQKPFESLIWDTAIFCRCAWKYVHCHV